MKKTAKAREGTVRLRTCFGEPSWQLVSETVEAWITQMGGQLAPVTFDRQGGRHRPYSIPPWHDEKTPSGFPTVLRVLRGDFLCLPLDFGFLKTGSDVAARPSNRVTEGVT